MLKFVIFYLNSLKVDISRYLIILTISKEYLVLGLVDYWGS